MPEIPFKKYLPRKVVLQIVGGRRDLERHEAEGSLVRRFPCGLKHARYLRTEVVAVVKSLAAT